MKSFFLACFAILSSLSLMAQGGNLQFNQAIKLTVSAGQITVPAGKVWKITASTNGGGVYYQNYTTSGGSWTVTRPNPCTGATTGSVGTIPYLYKYNCSEANNKVVVDGVKYNLSDGSPMWLPAGTTLSVSSTPCVNTLSPGITANSPYRVRDETGATTVYYDECDGPINQGITDNGIFISIIEFNIVP